MKETGLTIRDLEFNHENYTLGPYLAIARSIHGMTRIQVAEKLGCSMQSIYHAEVEKHIPKPYKLSLLGALYGLNVEILWKMAYEAQHKKLGKHLLKVIKNNYCSNDPIEDSKDPGHPRKWISKEEALDMFPISHRNDHTSDDNAKDEEMVRLLEKTYHKPKKGKK